MDETIIAKMKECGWSENLDGDVRHPAGMAFDATPGDPFSAWREALFACIEVASEA